MIHLYHGSTVSIDHIDLQKSRPNKSDLPAHDYDIVYGPIANDRVGVQIGKYEAGDITLDQFLNNLKYMKGVTFQYYFGTERAISKLHKV